ncbi:MAG: hypothetical protein ACRD50_14395 [Candidatus Acidiferrales bacterium]
MNENPAPPSAPAPELAAPARKPMSARWTWGIVILALLFVLMPFLLWNATWFGKPLTEAELAKAIADREHPRNIQHALEKIEERIEAGDPTVRRWYPQLVALASDNLPEIRLTDAWVMGQDNTSSEFHAALLKLLADPQPMVARNAALSLVRFHDDSGHALVVSLLLPYPLPASEAGTLRIRLKPGDVVNPGTLVAHLEVNGQKQEIRTQVPGTILRWLVSDGAAVAANQPVVAISPSETMVFEALRALVLIGTKNDMPDIAPYARGVEGFSPSVQQQANLTLSAIRSRQ